MRALRGRPVGPRSTGRISEPPWPFPFAQACLPVKELHRGWTQLLPLVCTRAKKQFDRMRYRPVLSHTPPARWPARAPRWRPRRRSGALAGHHLPPHTHHARFPSCAARQSPVLLREPAIARRSRSARNCAQGATRRAACSCSRSRARRAAHNPHRRAMRLSPAHRGPVECVTRACAALGPECAHACARL